jgi:hypothetical protein
LSILFIIQNVLPRGFGPEDPKFDLLPADYATLVECRDNVLSQLGDCTLMLRETEMVLQVLFGTKKPPARETRVRDTTKDHFSIAEIAAESHMSETYVREWFTDHHRLHHDCLIVPRPETMHKRRYVSLRVSPKARLAFFASHAA